MINIPKLLFKYRSLSNEESVERVRDIIENHRLFIPERTMVNDPFEGTNTDIALYVAGSSMYSAFDVSHPIISFARDKYRFLSLSENSFSPPLWAYYANTYEGVCLCYRTDGSFAKAKKVNYVDDRPDTIEEPSPDELSQIIENDLLSKHLDWAHEKEWRIIDSSTDMYFNYNPNELVCVIIGHKTNLKTVDLLRKWLSPNIPILTTHIGMHSLQIKLRSIDQPMELGGPTPQFICNVDELCENVLC